MPNERPYNAVIGMPELFTQARRDGMWLYSAYQNLWFTPDELELEQAKGGFRWGPINWQLRLPEQYIEYATRKLNEAQRFLVDASRRVAEWRAAQKP